MRSRLGASGCHNWLLETVWERLRHMTSNMHLLTHITQSVTHWGPTVGFESNMGTLMKYFHGTQNVPTQIVEELLKNFE